MNQQEAVAFQGAIQLAHAGQVKAAYDQFCLLASNKDNRNDPDLLLWIAETTASSEEAQRAINEVTSIAPSHPGLLQAQAQLARRPQLSQHVHTHLFPQMETYRCPFCGTSVKPIIQSKVSTAGWVIFFLLIFFIITIEICWLGLFIRQNVVTCPMCSRNLKGYV